MSNYFTLVNVDDKEVYGLGNFISAKEKLPIVAKKLKGKLLCFYGDESCPFGEDKYETIFNNKDFGEPWGPTYYDKGEVSINVSDYKDVELLTEKEFDIIMMELEGKELPDLYEKILKVKNIN